MIQVTHDDGANLVQVSPTGLPERATVNSIDPSPHDPDMAFAAVFARRDTHPYFFRTHDGGKTWEKIVTGLPDAGIARVVREDPVRKGMLFAGTETGVYVSFDCGDHWQSLQLGLPTSSVRDLNIHGDDLVAATFGRGLWILDDISPLRQLNSDLQKSPVHFFTPQTALRVHWDNHPDTPLQRDMPASQNPPDGALLYYFLNSPPKGEISLDVLDEKGNSRHSFFQHPAAGITAAGQRAGILVLSARKFAHHGGHQSFCLGSSLSAPNRVAVWIFRRTPRLHRIHASGSCRPRRNSALPAARSVRFSRHLHSRSNRRREVLSPAIAR